MRGNDRDKLFFETADFKYFEELIKKYATDGFIIYAYCLMDNHIHILAREGKRTISSFVYVVCSSYATYFKYKNERSGHVFEKRFYSSPVEDRAYFDSCLQYICENPVKAGIVQKPEEYLWLWINPRLQKE